MQENPTTGFQQQSAGETIKKNGLLSWVASKPHLVFTIIFLILSAVTAFSALVLIEPCYGGLGCIGLYPFAIASIPVQPILWLVLQILHKITYPYSSFYKIPSILKFFPAIIISTSAFFLGYIATHLILRLKRRVAEIGEHVENIRSVRKSFVFSNIIFILLFSGFIFRLAPPPPFASDAAIVKSCGLSVSEPCYANFVHSKISNCNKEKASFIYPLKVTFPQTDKCLLSSFSEEKLLKDISLSQGVGGSVIITSGPEGTKTSNPTFEMDILLNLFIEQLSRADVSEKEKFCNSFSEEIKSGGFSGNISNKEYCTVKLGFGPRGGDSQVNSGVEGNLVNVCAVALTREGWAPSDLQRKCFAKFANFQTYDPDPKIYDEFFGAGWQYISFQPGTAIYDVLAQGTSTLDVVYKLNVRKEYPELGIGRFDDLRVREGSVRGPLYDDYIDLAVKQKNIKTTGSPEERVGVMEEKILGAKVLVEHRVQHQNTGDRSYNIFHFIKNDIYVQVDGVYIFYLDNKKKNLLFRAIAKDMLGGASGRVQQQNTQQGPYPEKPVVDIKVNGSDGPVNASVGERVHLTWSSENGSDCSISGFVGIPGSVSPSGEKYVNIPEPSSLGYTGNEFVYALFCSVTNHTAEGGDFITVADDQVRVHIVR